MDCNGISMCMLRATAYNIRETDDHRCSSQPRDAFAKSNAIFSNNHCQLFFWYSWAFILSPPMNIYIVMVSALWCWCWCRCCCGCASALAHSRAHFARRHDNLNGRVFASCPTINLIPLYGHWTPYQRQFQYAQMDDDYFVQSIYLYIGRMCVCVCVCAVVVVAVAFFRVHLEMIILRRFINL